MDICASTARAFGNRAVVPLDLSRSLDASEPPEALYNQWIKDRIEYYKRVEPVAPPGMSSWTWGPLLHGSESPTPMIVAPWAK